jgi:hypothetical protein
LAQLFYCGQGLSQLVLLLRKPKLRVKLFPTNVFNEVLEDVSQRFQRIAPDLNLSVLRKEDKLEVSGLVGIAEPELQRIDCFQLGAVLLSPSIEEALADPLDVPCVPFDIAEPDSPRDLVLGLGYQVELPELRQDDLEGPYLVDLRGVAGMHERIAVDLSVHDVFSLEYIPDLR